MSSNNGSKPDKGNFLERIPTTWLTRGWLVAVAALTFAGLKVTHDRSDDSFDRGIPKTEYKATPQPSLPTTPKPATPEPHLEKEEHPKEPDKKPAYGLLVKNSREKSEKSADAKDPPFRG